MQKQKKKNAHVWDICIKLISRSWHYMRFVFVSYINSPDQNIFIGVLCEWSKCSRKATTAFFGSVTLLRITGMKRSKIIFSFIITYSYTDRHIILVRGWLAEDDILRSILTSSKHWNKVNNDESVEFLR